MHTSLIQNIYNDTTANKYVNSQQSKRVPLYIQLYALLKKDIEEGTIQAGQKLPSKRVLAERFMVSVVTVQNAYAQLLVEGYIYAKEKVGYFCCDMVQIKYNTHATQQASSSSTPTGSQALARTSLHVHEQYPRAHYPLDLCKNSILSQHFPFSVWAKQMRQVISENHTEILSRVPSLGLWALRKEISAHVYAFKGISIDPNRIFIGAGTEYLYSVLVKLLGRESIYAVEDPGHKQISRIYSTEGVAVHHLPLDTCGIELAALENSRANIVHISPSHHFPTGLVMPITRRKELLHWANAQKNRYIIEDDYDSEFRFSGQTLPTLQSIDSQGKVIYVNTFSKTISPSLRISYMILPQELVDIYHAHYGFYSCTVSSFDQHILAHFISKGHYERHINRMRRFYKKHRNAVLNLINKSPLAQYAQTSEDLSGLHFVLKLQTHKNDQHIRQRALARGLRLAFVSDYSTVQGHSQPSQLIINYSGINLEDMKASIALLLDILQE
ncbi:MAG: PLP-dependent aminotransferase family protein [Pseudomonadota bacterium]